MREVGEILDLDFPVKGVVNGEKWAGLFSELIVRPTIVSVYMRNNTCSCDRQVAQLVEVAPELEAEGIEVIGLSKDTVGSHSKYACKVGAGFPLISDTEHHFANATKSLVEKKMYGKTFLGPTRSAYLIDPGGKLLGVVETVDSANHAEQVRTLASLV